MRRRALATIGLVAVLVGLWVTGGAVRADNDLHDKDALLTDADGCAGCHRAHSAKAEKLLLAGPNQDDFCFTCHDGSGAETNVVNGVLIDGTQYGIGDDSDHNPLRGGGFLYAWMDTDHDGSVGNASVTSTHTADGTTTGLVMWGSGPINSETDYGKGGGESGAPGPVTLACGDCHNPHGNGNYRILRGNPDGMEDEETEDAVDVPEESPIIYEIDYDDSNYRLVFHVEPGMGWNPEGYDKDTLIALVDWCGQCHTRYKCTAGSGNTDSTDAVFAFRHWTEGIPNFEDGCIKCHEDKFVMDGGYYQHAWGHWSEPLYGGCSCHSVIPYVHHEDCTLCHGHDLPTPGHLEGCLACHVVHGTSATMGTYSGAVPYPDGTYQDGGGPTESRLLCLDNRMTCVVCHNETNLIAD